MILDSIENTSDLISFFLSAPALIGETRLERLRAAGLRIVPADTSPWKETATLFFATRLLAIWAAIRA